MQCLNISSLHVWGLKTGIKARFTEPVTSSALIIIYIESQKHNWLIDWLIDWLIYWLTKTRFSSKILLENVFYLNLLWVLACNAFVITIKERQLQNKIRIFQIKQIPAKILDLDWPHKMCKAYVNIQHLIYQNTINSYNSSNLRSSRGASPLCSPLSLRLYPVRARNLAQISSTLTLKRGPAPDAGCYSNLIWLLLMYASMNKKYEVQMRN